MPLTRFFRRVLRGGTPMTDRPARCECLGGPRDGEWAWIAPSLDRIPSFVQVPLLPSPWGFDDRDSARDPEFGRFVRTGEYVRDGAVLRWVPV